MAQHLLHLPAARIVVRPRVDTEGKPVLDESGKHLLDIQEIVDPLVGLELALQSVTQGPKLFEVWSLRKRIKEAMDRENPQASARYLLLDDAEKDILLTAVKTLDWTFGGKHMFWVEWEALFDAISGIKAYDETKPDAEYVAWRTGYEAAKAAKAKAIKDAEAAALAAAEAAKLDRETGIQALVDADLQEALGDLKRLGKLGPNAGIEDLSTVVRDTIRAQAERDYDAGKRWTSAPAEPAQVGA